MAARNNVSESLDALGNDVGGILVRGHEWWAFLPPGDEGQVLSIDDDGFPVWVGGSNIIVPPTAFPAANSVVIENIPQGFSALKLVVSGCSFNTASRNLFLKITGITSGYAGLVHDPGGNTAITTVLGVSPPPQGAAVACSVDFFITGYQAGMYASCDFCGFSTVARDGRVAYLGDTDAVTSLTLLVNSTGNFDAGTYALYGIN